MTAGATIDHNFALNSQNPQSTTSEYLNSGKRSALGSPKSPSYPPAVCNPGSVSAVLSPSDIWAKALIERMFTEGKRVTTIWHSPARHPEE